MKQTDKLFLRTENSEGKCIVYVGGELDLESAAQMRAMMSSLVELTDRD